MVGRTAQITWGSTVFVVVIKKVSDHYIIGDYHKLGGNPPEFPEWIETGHFPFAKITKIEFVS